MREYFVRFVREDEEDDCLVVLPSFLKLIFWFLRTARHCKYIVIFYEEDANGKR